MIWPGFTLVHNFPTHVSAIRGGLVCNCHEFVEVWVSQLLVKILKGKYVNEDSTCDTNIFTVTMNQKFLNTEKKELAVSSLTGTCN